MLNTIPKNAPVNYNDRNTQEIVSLKFHFFMLFSAGSRFLALVVNLFRLFSDPRLGGPWVSRQNRIGGFMAAFIRAEKRAKSGWPLFSCLTLMLLGVLGVAQPVSDEFPEILPMQLSASIRNFIRLPRRQFQVAADDAIMRRQNVLIFYERRGYRNAWVTPHAVSSQAGELMDVIGAAEQNGLQPRDYHWNTLHDLQQAYKRRPQHQPVWPEHLAAWDVLLTDAFLLYANHACYGRLDPSGFRVVEIAPLARFDLLEYLEKALAANRVADALADLQPRHPGYLRLREVLLRYHEIERTIPWREIGATPIKRGEQDKIAVPLMRIKLQALGDLGKEEPADATLLDDALSRALSRYQQRHGLPASGEWDPLTAAWLNQPLADIIRRLEINLERWRWLPPDLGPYYILVNIPGAQLDLIDHDRSVITMRVVIGKRLRMTPILSDRITYLVLNPAWDIPPRLLVRDKLHELRTEADFFARRRITVWDEGSAEKRVLEPGELDWKTVPVSDLLQRYHFRQAPGDSNPLGRIKFVLPNKFNVYLHDTNSKDLFKKEVRDFSSGCIRLEEPLVLANALLNDQGFWTPNRLAAAIRAGLEQNIWLTKPVPVNILYWTCWVNEDGTVHFRDDIYGLDQEMLTALHRPSAPAPAADDPAFSIYQKDKP
jgi:L,D-transpeptidase YcbB